METVVKIIISAVQDSFTDRVFVEALECGVECTIRNLDRKNTLLDAMYWPDVLDEDGWAYAVLINEAKRTVLLRADTMVPVTQEAVAKVSTALEQLGKGNMAGEIAFNDRSHALTYIVGPIVLEHQSESLPEMLLAMGKIVREASSVLDCSHTSASIG